jgi:hypothetical protein
MGMDMQLVNIVIVIAVTESGIDFRITQLEDLLSSLAPTDPGATDKKGFLLKSHR